MTEGHLCPCLAPGIGSGSALLEQCIELAQRPGVLQHWTSCQHLIIDEISMVEAQFFDKLESVARCEEKINFKQKQEDEMF